MQKHYQKACDSLAAQTLYVVATPIGNLADITLRALAVLSHVDIVCAEDTRVTGQLLSAYGIQAKLLSVREHNEQHMADKVIAALAEGKSMAQVSDAGTPAVCDPGAKLAARVREAGFKVVPVAGASAVMAALSVAGVADIQTALKEDGNQSRGEMVLILHPAQVEKHSDMPEAAQQVMKILAADLPTKQAADLAAKITGESKKALYDLALTWKA